MKTVTENDIISLLEWFGISHAKITHDPKSKIERFTAQGEDIFQKATDSLDITKYCLITSTDLYNTSTEDLGTKDYHDVLLFNFEVAKAIPKGEKFRRETQDEAREIAHDIWRELLFYIQHRIPPFERPTSIMNLQKNPTQGGAENITGYRFEITIKQRIDGISYEYKPFSMTPEEADRWN